jgi:uncharacterized membrane protein YcaP (DUF421 family)
MPFWLTVLLRMILIFFITLVLTRFIGKKTPARMTPFYFVDYAAFGIVAGLISVGIIGNLATGLIALAGWGLLPPALEYLALKSKWIHDLLNGKETILIKQGKIMEESLFQVRLTGEELLRELRSKNIFNLNEVEFAVMETTGEINVLPKSDNQPLTPLDLDQKVAPKAESQTVILDGNILDESLAGMGLDRNWLNLQLERLGVALNNVFLGQVDSSGDLYIDLFNDAIILPKPKVKELLYANLEKIQADLTTFSLETESQDARTMYKNYAVELEKLLERIKPYLLR